MRDSDVIALITHNIQKSDDSIVQAEALFNIEQYFGSVNRAYYAIFYAALGILLTKGLGSSKHSGVLSYFDREFVKTNEVDKKWSKVFHDAFELRSMGDYAKLIGVTKLQAETLIKDAKGFVLWAKQWLKERDWLAE
ncbi:MAG: HEPN domain-containing protein [Nitrospirae bacterium]|nr:HEPN domain-containing protein [Nitrospirota bacterium]